MAPSPSWRRYSATDGRPADDFEVRVFVGAMVGAMMAAYDSAPMTADTIYWALDFLDAGMRLD